MKQKKRGIDRTLVPMMASFPSYTDMAMWTQNFSRKL